MEVEMPPQIRGPVTHDPDPQVLAPPYPDLFAYPSFSVAVNHPNRTICLSGFISNVGNARVRQSFYVALGITYVRFGVTISSEKIVRIDDDIIVGERIATPCMLQNLIYLDEDPGAYYTFEMIVDVFNDISELRSSNNRHREDGWYFLNPALREKVNNAIDQDADFQIDISPPISQGSGS